ncbi:hypothetical protein DY000_02042612 [Brassica cretica]|uniref:Ubiquitin-like protease family profile domain-containing protein n=1 Tax=Brassica cretica TaxID=69181 RepID=A0ABQ7BBA3_BRACR|nr:hypothetical protein DY000_02042612 [Brassica cretica]
MTTTASNSIHNPHEDSPVKNPSTTVSAQSVSSSGNMGSPLSRAEQPTTIATTPASDDPALCQYFVIPLWRGNGYGTMFAQGVVALSESYFGSGSSFCNLVLLSVTGTEAMFSNLGHFTSVSIRVSGGSMSECCTSVLSLASHPFNICPCWPCLVSGGSMSECCTSVLSLASHPFNICPCWPCLLQIRDAVQARAGQDKNHGVILIPEGIVESIHELYALLKEGVHADNISTQLSPWSSTLFEFLPPFIKKQLAFAFLVYPCLVVQYMGQSAFLSKNLGLFSTIFTVQSQNLSQSSNYVDKGTQESLQDTLGNLYKTLWETFLKHHMLKDSWAKIIEWSSTSNELKIGPSMLTSELAARIMGPTEWLLNHEIDAMMYLFTEMTTLQRWEPSKVAFMSCMFSNQMKTSFEEFRKDKKKFKVSELLHWYDIGELPAHGRTRLMWDLDVTCMYVPLNVGKHWISMCVNFFSQSIEVFDCEGLKHNKEVEPFAFLIPRIVKSVHSSKSR